MLKVGLGTQTRGIGNKIGIWKKSDGETMPPFGSGPRTSGVIEMSISEAGSKINSCDSEQASKADGQLGVSTVLTRMAVCTHMMQVSCHKRMLGSALTDL